MFPRSRNSSVYKQWMYRHGLTASRPTIHRRQFGGGFGGDPAVVEEILNTDHRSDKEVTAETDPAELFADAGACVLSPELTEGPLCKFPERKTVNLLDCSQALTGDRRAR